MGQGYERDNGNMGAKTVKNNHDVGVKLDKHGWRGTMVCVSKRGAKNWQN